MRITAVRLGRWADRRDAQAELPRLMRRLVHRAATTTAVAIPSGESVGISGWDGVVHSEHGSSWVPKGNSAWEISCEKGATSKANSDYAKRATSTAPDERKTNTFVFVTARRWSAKARWVAKKRSEQVWLDVRAYDADDLEQWLEESPAVALAFGEELGIVGAGVESLARTWQTWSSQCDPTISPDALFSAREVVRAKLLTEVRRAIVGNRPPITLRGDSIAEAVAFACAAILNDADLSRDAVVVTHLDGWRYIEKNSEVKVAIAADPEIAARAVKRNGMAVIAPVALGDMSASLGRDTDSEFGLERPDRQAFEKALASLGIEQSDAERLAQTSGRSWSVIRRHHATNPAIRSPAWLTNEHSWVVSTMCLAGSWLSTKEADKAIIERIAGRPYEDIERALAALTLLDDAPILKIGDVWKAKAPLELLDQYGARITTAEFERFFAVVREALSAADPILELPDEERYAAAIHGKVRPVSVLLLRALADGLAKLSVRGVLVPTLADAGIDQQVARVVRDILHEADETRWLSLDGFFRPLAEAAPDTFIQAMEASFRSSGAPVTILIKETRSTSLFGGRCWHADLLWALEILAWSPQRLGRVCRILAQLTRVKTESTWNNSPLNTLVDIFRAWLPQTAATLEQRLVALDTLIDKEQGVAFELLDKLVYTGSDTASPSARPKWRDDDAGAGYAATRAEYSGMYLGAADRLLRLSAKDASRLAKLLEKIDGLDNSRRALVLGAAKGLCAAEFSDEDREILRKAVRQKLHWERNYRQDQQEAIEKHVASLQELYDLLSPVDLTVRHGWLFENGWPETPLRVRDDGVKGRQTLTDELRNVGILEIYKHGGLDAVERLARRQPRAWFVGWSIPHLGIATQELSSWIVARSTKLTSDDPLAATVSGLLHATPNRTDLLNETIRLGITNGWASDIQARLLALAPHTQETWDYVTTRDDDVADHYWKIAQPGFIGEEPTLIEYVVRKLLAAQRPRTALNVCRFGVGKIDPNLLADLLERMLAGEEMEGHLPDSWHVREAVTRLESSGEIDKQRLIRLEFGLIPALGHDNERCAKTLFVELMSDPGFFVEILKVIFRPTAQKANEPTEQTKTIAEIAFRVLQHCKQIPGSTADGTIDAAAFSAFISKARELAAEADRVKVCDIELGEILAHAPAGDDGVWPFKAARDLLDQPELDDMRRGLRTGLYNKRGMVTKSYGEGGGQERGLAANYCQQAASLHQSHSLLAAVLDDIANYYERHGRDEDIEARLRQEAD